MKTPFLTFIFLILFICPVVRGEPPGDAEATKKLVGAWIIPERQNTKGGGFTFSSDGTFTSYGIFKIKDQEIRIEVEGKWKVDKGILIEEITKSSHEQIVSIGFITRDTLLEVTDKKYRFLTEKGQEDYRVRKEG